MPGCVPSRTTLIYYNILYAIVKTFFTKKQIQVGVKPHGLKAYHEHREKLERMKFLRMRAVPAHALLMMAAPLKAAHGQFCYAFALANKFFLAGAIWGELCV